jgi:hypothetical protein
MPDIFSESRDFTDVMELEFVLEFPGSNVQIIINYERGRIADVIASLKELSTEDSLKWLEDDVVNLNGSIDFPAESD